MKKILCIITVLLLMSGCGEKLMNTPTKKVETLFNNYQTLNNDVLDDLDAAIGKNDTFNETQADKYRTMMKNHYQNLIYKIKDEETNGDTAIVTVEIEVTDYSKIMAETNTYYNEHISEFVNETGEYDQSKFLDYQLEQYAKTNDKVKYTLDITLTKVNDKWQVDKLSDDDLDKINGIYTY